MTVSNLVSAFRLEISCESSAGMNKSKTHNLSSAAVMFSALQGAQWLKGRVLDSRPRGRGFKPNKSHCVVVLEQDTFILA